MWLNKKEEREKARAKKYHVDAFFQDIIVEGKTKSIYMYVYINRVNFERVLCRSRSRSARWANVCGGWLASIDLSNLCVFARKEEKNKEKVKSFLSLHETRCLISSKVIDKLRPAFLTQGDEFSWTRSWRNDVRWISSSFFIYLSVQIFLTTPKSSILDKFRMCACGFSKVKNENEKMLYFAKALGFFYFYFSFKSMTCSRSLTVSFCWQYQFINANLLKSFLTSQLNNTESISNGHTLPNPR